MTRVDSDVLLSGQDIGVDVWRLDEAGIVAAGATPTIQSTGSAGATTNFRCTVASYENVSQTSPVTASAADTQVSALSTIPDLGNVVGGRFLGAWIADKFQAPDVNAAWVGAAETLEVNLAASAYFSYSEQLTDGTDIAVSVSSDGVDGPFRSGLIGVTLAPPIAAGVLSPTTVSLAAPTVQPLTIVGTGAVAIAPAVIDVDDPVVNPPLISSSGDAVVVPDVVTLAAPVVQSPTLAPSGAAILAPNIVALAAPVVQSPTLTPAATALNIALLDVEDPLVRSPDVAASGAVTISPDVVALAAPTVQSPTLAVAGAAPLAVDTVSLAAPTVQSPTIAGVSAATDRQAPAITGTINETGTRQAFNISGQVNETS